MTAFTPSPDDPFATLGLARRFDIDRAELQAKYLERSARLHPDLAGDDPEVLEKSEELNAARATLIDPEKRAVALWALLRKNAGVRAQADDKALPPGFLMNVMELREELEAAQQSRDASALARFETLAGERRTEHERAVGELLGLAMQASTPELLQKIKLELNAWRYTERLIEQLG